MITRQQMDSWMYIIIFYMCQIFGVFPVAVNILFTPTPIPTSNQSPSSRKSKRVFTVIQIIACTLFANLFAPSFSELIDLPPFAVIWLINWLSAISVLVFSLLSQSLVECFLSASALFSFQHQSHMHFPIYLFLLLLICPFATLIYMAVVLLTGTLTDIFGLFVYNYGYIPVACVEVLISTLCLIGETAHGKINSELVKFNKRRINSKEFSLFVNILEQHVTVAQYVNKVARYFSPHFLVIFLSCLFRLIIYTVLSVKNRRLGNFGEVSAIASHSFYLIFRLIFLCYRCHKVKQEAAETRDCVRRLRVKWMNQLTEDQTQLTDVYEELMEALDVKFTACGFFPVSPSQVLNVLGLTLTYGLLAALQS